MNRSLALVLALTVASASAGTLGSSASTVCATNADCVEGKHCYAAGTVHAACVNDGALGGVIFPHIWKPPTFPGIHFDLTKLKEVSGKAYTLKDPTVRNKNGTDRWHYVFNIGDNVVSPPTSLIPEICHSTTGVGTNGTSIVHDGPAPVYQVYDDGKLCHRLGADVADPANYEYSLFDKENPMMGVTLTYKNGDECYAPAPGQMAFKPGREFSITLLCEDDDNLLPDIIEDAVTEDYMCRYSTQIKTSHGCPLECPRDASLSVCGGQGTCEWDKATTTARCICEDGYKGPGCTGKCPDTCGMNGMCGFNTESKKAECFCRAGYEGVLCAIPVAVDEAEKEAIGKKIGEGLVSCAGPWVMFFIALFGLIAFYVYHKKKMGLPVNPCADVMYASGVPAGGSYTSSGTGDYRPMGGETGSI